MVLCLESITRRRPRVVLPTFLPASSSTPLSPFTGMERNDWIACANHVLKGAFAHVNGFNQALLLPKNSAKSYPWLGRLSFSRLRRAEASFEALVRTFNLAAPLIAENENAAIRGIRLADYYKHHLLAAITEPKCAHWIGLPNYRSPRQPTIELGFLALWSILDPKVWWYRLDRSQQDNVAAAMKTWANGPTCDNNWRWFNVMMLTFLELRGYKGNQDQIRSHIDKLLIMHVGDGWYKDVGFDYYTSHAFQLFGAVWSKHYGRIHEPTRAEQVDQNLRKFTKTGSMLFSREGKVNMYGRSVAYRQAATAGMVAAFLGDNFEGIKPGEARRVCSAALLQFLSRTDTFEDGIPTLGFYGSFDPAVQRYSCSASPYAMFIGFMALTLPAKHRFWSDSEESGAWESIAKDEAKSTFLAGPKLLLSNHGGTGTAEIRPCWSSKASGYEIEQYNRQTYNSSFPWEKSSSYGPVSAQLRLNGKEDPQRSIFKGYEREVLYRQNIFKSGLVINTASIVLNGAEVRLDWAIGDFNELQLAHYSMPHFSNISIDSLSCDDKTTAISISSNNLELEIVNYQGWCGVDKVTRTNMHPEAPQSTTPYLYSRKPTARPLVSILKHSTGAKKSNNSPSNLIQMLSESESQVDVYLFGFKKLFVVNLDIFRVNS